MATAPKFRIDVDIHNLLMASGPVKVPEPKGMALPEPVFPRYPEKLADPGPDTPPKKRDWTLPQVYRSMRGWLFPYVRSRVLPGDFHPITAYLFVEYKCNLDCWYCWAFNNKVKGMTEDVARRSIDWLYDHGCRVLALMGGEPLLRPQFAWHTAALWGLPPAALLIGIVAIFVVARRRRRVPPAEVANLNAAEEARLAELLRDS